jgi:hypothetical protein
MPKIKTETGHISRRPKPIEIGEQLSIMPERGQYDRVPYTITYSQPWMDYFVSKAYHHLWCQYAGWLLRPIDKLRYSWADKRARKSDPPAMIVPVYVQREYRCHELSKKGRAEISTELHEREKS